MLFVYLTSPLWMLVLAAMYLVSRDTVKVGGLR